MSLDDYETMWLAITTIEAQAKLQLLSVADWPNMKKGKRERLHKDLFKKAYPASFKEKKIVTQADFAKLLHGG